MADIQHIISPHNAKVGFLRSLQTSKGRVQEQAWLIEGPHLLQEALKARLLPQFVLYDPAALAPPLQQALATLAEEQHVEIAATTPQIIARVAETQTPQGVIAALPLSAMRPDNQRSRRGVRPRPLSLVLDDLQDPGNVGTILRSALAADVDAVYLTSRCADVFGSKVVRAGSGAHFYLPIYTNQSWPAIDKQVNVTGQDMQVIIADSGATDEYTELDLTQPTTLIIGNEAHGPSAPARKLATHTVRVFMYNGVESLNAAIAASIMLFESVRQRRAQRGA